MFKGYTHVIDAGNVARFTVTGLKEGVTYFFAATAYDKDGNESAFSEELTHHVAFGTPGQAKGLTYKVLRITW